MFGRPVFGSKNGYVSGSTGGGWLLGSLRLLRLPTVGALLFFTQQAIGALFFFAL